MARKKSKKKILSWDKKLFAGVILLVGIFTILAIVSIISQSTEMRKYAAEYGRMAPAATRCNYYNGSCHGCIVSRCRFCTNLNTDQTTCIAQDEAITADYSCTQMTNDCPAGQVTPTPRSRPTISPPEGTFPITTPPLYREGGFWNRIRSWFR